jgi:hypothetical protein
MSRPLRIEFAGALCHVTARGYEQKAIVWDVRDREVAGDARARLRALRVALSRLMSDRRLGQTRCV